MIVKRFPPWINLSEPSLKQKILYYRNNCGDLMNHRQLQKTPSNQTPRYPSPYPISTSVNEQQLNVSIVPTPLQMYQKRPLSDFNGNQTLIDVPNAICLILDGYGVNPVRPPNSPKTFPPGQAVTQTSIISFGMFRDGPGWDWGENSSGVITQQPLPLRTKDAKVALKLLHNSSGMDYDFLKEIKTHINCVSYAVVQCYGLSQDPKTKDYLIVMEYANYGDLRHYIHKHYLSWKQILDFLTKIAAGLCTIHQTGFVHKDFHSGNILMFSKDHPTVFPKIADLGLSGPTQYKENTSGKNEKLSFAQKLPSPSSIKSSHDVHLVLDICLGKRPDIQPGTPDCYAKLMKRCWSDKPEERPSMMEVYNEVLMWDNIMNKRNMNSNDTNDEYVKFYKDFLESESVRKQLFESDSMVKRVDESVPSEHKMISSTTCSQANPIVTGNNERYTSRDLGQYTNYITRAYDDLSLECE
ncbi:7860_t:CDS:2 [Acaulospora morrowiae]|uniref:7860_t:CDS:1 n=1 Tax=Acaulospora morrowiae TaxID=94023 RepID=A0A9N8YRY3_9GLOM|nr:7860_t:CDS:2 [Acaulospora morrowiae]